MKNTQHGFITLFFVLSISSILLTWVLLGSLSVFEYISAKRSFDANRLSALSVVTCADTFVGLAVRSYQTPQPEYSFARQLFYGDELICQIKNIAKSQISPDMWQIYFISDTTAFTATVRNGFVESW